jgi:hypothetical protein
MGVCGLWCFIVGYARLRNDLKRLDGLVLCSKCFQVVIMLRHMACRDVPDGIAVLAGLAVQEPQLLERLAENVFAAHFCAGNL